MTSYTEFIRSKRAVLQSVGFEVPNTSLNPSLWDWQQAIVRWAVMRGRAALFLDTGLGKTAQQLEWARLVHEQTGGNVLILAPLAVAQQTEREGAKFGIRVKVCRDQADVQPGINITNYEMLHHFDAAAFVGIVLDESSILKSYNGATRTAIIDAFAATPYRLACTATPAPNDFMELGNHAEFLGIMTRTEMLAMFFTHDGGETSKWRLKGHAQAVFWEWMASWSVMIRKPSDLGFDDAGYLLPPLHMHQHIVDVHAEPTETLFVLPAQSLMERRQARRQSLSDRVAKAAALANATSEQVLVWCDLNDEGDALTSAIDGAVQVTGSDSPEQKAASMLAFTDRSIRVLVSKPSICGFGMNWQHAHHMIFVGLSDSYEALYQAIRREWRFGQTEPVHVHLVLAETEGAVLANIQRKQADHDRMVTALVSHMAELTTSEIKAARRAVTAYTAAQRVTVPAWLRSECYV